MREIHFRDSVLLDTGQRFLFLGLATPHLAVLEHVEQVVIPGGAQFFLVETRLAGHLELRWPCEFGLVGGSVGADASPQKGGREELPIAILDHLLDVQYLLAHGEQFDLAGRCGGGRGGVLGSVERCVVGVSFHLRAGHLRGDTVFEE